MQLQKFLTILSFQTLLNYVQLINYKRQCFDSTVPLLTQSHFLYKLVFTLSPFFVQKRKENGSKHRQLFLVHLSSISMVQVHQTKNHIQTGSLAGTRQNAFDDTLIKSESFQLVHKRKIFTAQYFPCDITVCSFG